MKTVVILSAGLATRLRPITDIIPKCLVNYGQHTVLKHLYDCYSRLGADKIVVAVHSKFKGFVKGYCDYMDLNVEIQTVDEPYGSAYAISKLNGISGNVIFNWADVIPTFTGFEWDKNAIYTSGNQCRFLFDGATFSKSTTGNVIGIYQLKNWVNQENDKNNFDGKDFVETLNHSDFKQIDVPVIDVGDFEKLKAASKNLPICREFNSVEFKGEEVVKKALTEKGIELQKNELNWYLATNDPKIVKLHGFNANDNTLVLERAKGKSFANDFDFDKVKEILSLSFGPTEYKPAHVTQRDFEIEFEEKVISRLAEIANIICAYDIKTINDVEQKPVLRLLARANQYLNFKCDKAYTIIHGDLNFSNIISTEDGLKIIDPRGYFGNTKLYGPKFYDEAKVLYALSGYDKFNSDPLWDGLTISGTNATIDIEPLVNIYSDEVKSLFNKEHYVALGIIWISLAGYFKNNPYKALAAYYYGVYILDKELKGLGRALKNGDYVDDEPNVNEYVLKTKCPGKWLLTDLETGQSYMPGHCGDFHWILVDE